MAVDCAGEAKNSDSVDIACEAKDCVAVYACVFEIDTCGAVLADDDLEFVVPPIGASADLHALFDLRCAAEHVLAEVGARGWFGVVEAENVEGRVDYSQTLGVVGTFIPGHDIS